MLRGFRLDALRQCLSFGSISLIAAAISAGVLPIVNSPGNQAKLHADGVRVLDGDFQIRSPFVLMLFRLSASKGARAGLGASGRANRVPGVVGGGRWLLVGLQRLLYGFDGERYAKAD